MKKYLLFLITAILISCNDDLEGNLEWGTFNGIPENIELIEKKDPLFNYLGLTSKDTSSENTDIACIEFIYPFVLFEFDEDDEYVKQVSVRGNENFAELLDNLEEGYSIGLSYPISGNLEDGTPVTVEDNAQLQQSLETCIEEELEIIIGNCNAIATAEKCIWKITQSNPEESQYIDSFFTLREDGSVVFSVLQVSENEEIDESEEELEYETEVGTWIFYFIGTDLHMNINFGPIEKDDNGEILESETVKSDWNFDWKINYIDLERIEIEKTFTQIVESDNGEDEEVFTENITLKKECKDGDDNEDISNK